MRPTQYRIKLTKQERTELEKLVRTQTSPQNKVKRSKIILYANEEGKSNKWIANKLEIYLCDVTKWTKRWIERDSESTEERISDLPRSGSPCQITPEQWCQIMAMACEPPEKHGIPITHWTHKELARTVIKQGIVKTISSAHLGSFLKKQTSSHIVVATG